MTREILVYDEFVLPSCGATLGHAREVPGRYLSDVPLFTVPEAVCVTRILHQILTEGLEALADAHVVGKAPHLSPLDYCSDRIGDLIAGSGSCSVRDCRCSTS
jgi:hypothetical protein